MQPLASEPSQNNSNEEYPDMKPSSATKFLLLTFLLSSAGMPFASYAGIVCGDGVISEDQSSYPEECDEGQEAATNICNNNTDPTYGNGPCFYTFCGDGIVQTPNNGANKDGTGFPEDCDPPGETLPTATCDATCTDITTTTTTAAPATTTTTTAAPGTTTTTTAAPATTTTTVSSTTTTTLPSGGEIVIDGCETGVQDPGGLSAALAACEIEPKNHGQYKRCVRHVTRDAKQGGDISAREKGAINRCAKGSSIGK